MNKVFKWIYYPVLVALAVVLFALGVFGAMKSDATADFSKERRAAVDTHITTITGYGGRNEAESDVSSTALSQTADYIRLQVRSGGSFVKYHSTDYPDGDGLNTRAAYIRENGVPKPTVVLQSAKILASTAEAMGADYYVDRTVVNVVVAIPGADTLAKYADKDNDLLSYGDVIMMTAHYDSSTVGEGAADNAAAVANMIELVKEIASRTTPYKNDFVFVFTSGEEEGALGANAFAYQFKAFDDIYSRVKLAFNFDAAGDAGFLVMSEMNGDASLASAYASIAGKSYSSSIYSGVKGAAAKASDFDIYDKIASMNFTTLPDDKTDTAFDTKDNLSAETVNALGNMMLKVADYFGDKTIGDYKADGRVQAGFFNYLGGNVWYANYVAYIVAAIIILLAAAATAVAIRFKAFDVVKAAFGAGVQALAALATLACLYVAYFVIALVLCGFEVINFHAICSVVYGSVGAMVFAVILTLAVSAAVYSPLKKAFGLRAIDVVRGGALLMALAAVVFCFVLPSVSYIFSIVAVLQMAVMLVNALLGKKFKAKFGFDIERLFLYVVPVILMLPVLGGELWLLHSTTAAVLLPLYLTVVALYGGAIMPFADYFTKKLKALCAIKANAESEATVAEAQTATASAEVKPVKKTAKAKPVRTFNYTTAFGSTAVAFVCVVAITLFSAFGGGFGSGISSDFGYYDELYKDSVVYVTEGGTSTIEVRDLDAYKYVARKLDGFKWYGEKNAYVKTENVGSLDLDDKLTVTADSANKKLFTVKTDADNTAHVVVTLSDYGAGNITKVTFTEPGGKQTEIDLGENTKKTLTFRLPYGYESGFTFEITGAAESVKVTAEQRNVFGSSSSVAQNNSAFAALAEYYSAGSEDVKNNLRFAVIMRSSETFSL